MSASEVTSPTIRLPRGPEDASPGSTDDFREHEDSEVTSARFDWEHEIRACVDDADDPRLGDRARYAAAKLALVNGGDVGRALTVLESRPDSAGATFAPWLRVVRETRLTAGSLLGGLDVLAIERDHERVSLRRAALAVEEAYLWWRLQVNETASAALDRARALEPGFSPAVVAAQLLAERQGDAPRLLAVLGERLAAAKTPEERAHALVRIALLTEPDPRRAEETLTLWLRALDEGQQTDVAAVARAGVARVAARLGRDADWSRALTVEAEASEPGLLRAASLSALASLQRYRLGTPEKATALLTRARTDDPSDWFLALALFDDQRAGRRWARALAILDELGPGVGSEDEDLAAAWFMEGAHLAEHQLDDAVGAAARLRKVLALKPSDPVALQSLERLASRTGDLGLQTELAMGAVGRADDADERAALAVRAADFNCAALDDVEGALSFLRRALESVPAYGPAVHLFERLCPRTERWDELARMWEEIAFLDADEAEKATSEARARAEHLARLGRLYEEKTADSARAIAAYRGWVETGVRRVGAFWALLRAAENAGDGLVAAEAALGLGTRCPALPAEARLAWCYRAATIFEEQAADDEAAIAAYEAALAIAPRFRPAWAGLARAQRRRKSFEGLAGAVVAWAACEANQARAAALEVEAARVLQSDLARPEKALEALDRALGFDGHCVAALWARARLLAELDHTEIAVEAFGRLADDVRSQRARVAFWRRQAELLEWKLIRPAEALVPVARARKESGAEVGGSTPGWVAIQVTEERLLQLLGRPVNVALASADAWPEGKDSVGRLFVLALRLGEEHQSEALALLAHVAESEPDNGFAREIEASKRGPSGYSRELAAALVGWSERCGDTDFRAGILRAALTILHELDVDDEGCYPVVARLVEVSSDADVAFTVDRLASRKREWPRVIAIRRRGVEVAQDDRARAVALWDLAIARFESGDRTGALAELGRSVELDVDYLPALRLLAFLEQQKGNAARAASLWERMGRLLRDPGRAADAWRRASRFHEDSLSDVNAAGRCLEEVLKLTPESDVDFRRLVGLLDDEAGRKRLLALARRRAGLGEGAVRRERLYELSQLLQTEDPTAAVEPLAAAVELDPTHMPTALALADLQEKLGRPAETAAVLVRVAGVAPGPEALVTTWKRVGRLALERLDDPSRAASAFENALLVDNQDPEAWEGLIQALNRQRHFAEAAACLRQLAVTDQRPATRFDHWMALADLLEGALDDPEGAAAAYEEALELEPGREDAHQALQKVLLRLDDPDRTARALARYLGVFPQAAAERRRLAELLSGPLSQPARAAEEWRVLVTQNPGDRAARIALASALERAGRDREAVAEHLALINLEALRLESLRALRRLFERLGERRRAQLALGVLVALGAAAPEDERAVREARLRFVPEPKAPLGPGDFDSVIRHPGESHPATSLVVAMADAVSKIFPGRLEDWGARPTDRLPPDDPARGLVNIVARAVGMEGAFDVYVSPAGLAQVEAESLSPPALILPNHVLQTLPRQEAMMQMARWLGRMRAGTLAVARLPGKDLALVVAAALRTRDPNYGKGLVPEEALVETSQKIVRLLPRKQRRAFEQALAAVGRAPALEVERWRSALGHTAYRAAVAVSGDVVGAIENVVRQDRRLAAAAAVSVQDLWNAARKNVEVVQLVNFALSDGLATLQDRLGW